MPVGGDVFLALTCDGVCAATTGRIVCTDTQRKRDLTPPPLLTCLVRMHLAGEKGEY